MSKKSFTLISIIVALVLAACGVDLVGTKTVGKPITIANATATFKALATHSAELELILSNGLTQTAVAPIPTIAINAAAQMNGVSLCPLKENEKKFIWKIRKDGFLQVGQTFFSWDGEKITILALPGIDPFALPNGKEVQIGMIGNFCWMKDGPSVWASSNGKIQVNEVYKGEIMSAPAPSPTQTRRP
ncbi:MAG: hypothetical protein AAB508_05185 [Patescibacteria group bacterium]